jgi:hypothetical protein
LLIKMTLPQDQQCKDSLHLITLKNETIGVISENCYADIIQEAEWRGHKLI